MSIEDERIRQSIFKLLSTLIEKKCLNPEEKSKININELTDLSLQAIKRSPMSKNLEKNPYLLYRILEVFSNNPSLIEKLKK